MARVVCYMLCGQFTVSRCLTWEFIDPSVHPSDLQKSNYFLCVWDSSRWNLLKVIHTDLNLSWFVCSLHKSFFQDDNPPLSQESNLLGVIPLVLLNFLVPFRDRRRIDGANSVECVLSSCR